MRSTFRPALTLMSGRIVGGVAAAFVPLALVRLLDPDGFGTYKQAFLLYTTIFGIAQVGMAESLYYFLPHERAWAGRFVANSLLVLAGAGLICLGLLAGLAPQAASAMNNPALAGPLPLLGVYVMLMLVSSVLEIAMTASGRFALAASSFAASEVFRSACLIVPALMFGSVAALVAGACFFAAVRAVAAAAWIWSEYGAELRLDPALLRRQAVYAFPFAAAIVVHVLQENLHQYAVASRFDAVVFAVYAVGCLQIPMVDFLSTSVSSVMMVHLAENRSADRPDRNLACWHDTTRKLALIFGPMVGLLVLNSRAIVEILFTSRFVESAPILTLWSLAFLAAILQVDGVLRAFADTRFLLFMNLWRLGLVLVLIRPFLDMFGLRGAVMVTLLALFTGKAIALARIGSIMRSGFRQVLPWVDLCRIGAACVGALPPALLVRAAMPPQPWVSLAASASTYAAVCGALVLLLKAVTLPARRGRPSPDRSMEMTA